MNIFEFAERYHLSLAKSRRIAKDNPAWFRDTDSVFDPIRTSLANGDKLTAAQLVELIEAPAGLLELGKYAGRAEAELSALGKPQAAPMEVVANIMEAAKGEPEALEILIGWLKTIIGEKPVSHAYIAVRLLLGTPANIRKSEGPRIPRALLNARKQPSFAGYWHLQPVASGKNRNITIYQKKMLDL